MARSVYRLQRAERRMKPHIFGVRHLSPAAAYHLETLLNILRPTAVLIEGPADATSLISDITKQRTVPPIAIMAYTQQLPVQTIVYPLAAYSPEYRAMKWASDHEAHVEFIDLPSNISIAFRRSRKSSEPMEEGEPSGGSLYEDIAMLAGEQDYESYWERSFEHVSSFDAFTSAIMAFSKHLRELEEEEEDAFERKWNALRESFMRDRIARVIREGHRPEKVAVITGAYHVTGLMDDTLPLCDISEMASIPTKLTLMPYSNFKLSSQSGYGAGNHAPAYFDMMWECIKENDRAKLPAYYLSSVAAHLRNFGTFRSSAEVIEGVRLAHALASFRDSPFPVLRDLRDAATVCLGHGDFSIIAEACAKAEVGTSIGALPDGVSQTPIQDDFSRELKRLKIKKYRTNVAHTLQLDLRENRRVKSREAAFLDLHRSVLFHRLHVLGISFATPVSPVQEDATWAEHWNLRWTPEVEIQVVESTLRGETIELATAFVLKEQMQACQQVAEAARLVHTAYICGMLDMLETARWALQHLAVNSGDFIETAVAASEIARVLQYGDVRKINTDAFLPILKQLFLRSTLLLPEAAGCNNDAAKEVMKAIHEMNMIAQEFFEIVDEARWTGALNELSNRDDRNPMLSGYACSLLLERNQIEPGVLAQEVSRRLSPGVPVDLGAGWFEGLCMRNKYALLSRSYLWEKVDEYILSLTDEEFTRALVFLRRSFAHFSASDRAKVAEILGDVCFMDSEQTSEYLNQPLTEAEEAAMDELNEFDFGDI